MLVEVKVPVLSESVAEATLLSWHKKAGEHVDRDENLIDIETDKVVLELPAPATGVLARIIKDDGATVVGGEIIATIDTEAAGASPAAVSASPASSNTEPVPVTAADATSAPAMMPAARNLAAQANLGTEEISSIKGSGRDGRITKEDVAAHMKSKPSSSPAAPLSPPPSITAVPALGGNRPEQRVPMSRLRARIAGRLVQSQSTAAILTTFNEVNMQAIMDLRARYRDKFEKEYGVKLGLTSFFVKAAVAALKKFPIVNASVDGNDIIYHGYFDIGIAVSSPRGLVVPIIRDADSLTQAGIERQIADFGKRAMDGKLTIEELTGGTFSITNGGVFGSMLSTPIINPPQSAILGIHATKDRPVAENGQVVIRPMTYLALSYDHRIIDGREAVLSLVAMKEALEYPMSPLLEA
ncbi:2-oxoglutarate dehydrogenase E2 component [Nitrosospira sp. Nsp5]|uniref:Dihydrolipoyllysine-residue succinyltransferase component of 2-oxoglutarate dehydrogenase complex n=1 Tax=Nitrosospira multiformis TaxID=1231 RepID=A0ABY0TJ80_9PROT|nr:MULTISPECIES: 2-oxoglutarate dehydrogenase complex dihydrolipoyllysine-residue succinyltransferase [Nitrosospira]PTR05947.1 2-oxoglutarate dehydrogenase E2 component [Nitrosospira sp. Nsp5]SDQ92459.1 2-oxoglutarate dehydrogenase E2 component [Nitrosospira multiformis]